MGNKTNQKEGQETRTLNKKSLIREYTEAILMALLLALVIRTFVIQAFKIPSGSMKNTLLIGDHILVSKFSYGIHIPNEIPFTDIKLFSDIRLFASTPARGDIIVFKFPRDESRDFIKRVIGLPGDKIQIARQKVYINNRLYNDPFARHTESPSDEAYPPRDDFGPTMVPAGHLFMLGDNRENSQDSRFWGFLDINKVKGRAIIIYWSWNNLESWVRTERFGQVLQ